MTEDKLKTDTSVLQKQDTTQKKQTTKNTAKQNYPGLVASYDTRPGNEVGLFYNAPSPHGADATCDEVVGLITLNVFFGMHNFFSKYAGVLSLLRLPGSEAMHSCKNVLEKIKKRLKTLNKKTSALICSTSCLCDAYAVGTV